MILAAYDQHVVVQRVVGRQAVEAQRGGLQQRVIAEQPDQLFRKTLARHRPQARAGTAGENHGLHGETCADGGHTGCGHAGDGHTGCGCGGRRMARFGDHCRSIHDDTLHG